VRRDLDGKVALVTGGGRGIGRAISLSLARRGANLVVVYLRNRAAAHEVCTLAAESGVRAVAVRANVGDAAQIDALVCETKASFGRADILISNAATGVIRPFAELDERAWSWTMDANARALFLLARRALALMPPGATIVSISSQGATRVLPGYAIVGASKAAIESISRYLAVELAPAGVRVNVVSPGVVDTDALRHFPNREDILARAESHTPAGRLVSPRDVADAVDFLTSPRAQMITGHVLTVDGGASLLA
jgi:enoyl-[acyl-carrier protein] reductase III